MSETAENERCLIRCETCGKIITGMVLSDGTLCPVGVSDEGICGDAEFEVISPAETGPVDGQL